MDKQLTSSVPEHNHDVQHAETAVHNAKQGLKKKAAETDLPTKKLTANAVSGMGFETRAKLGCHLSSLSRMARRSRQEACRHPSNPRNLEDLILPPDYIRANSGDLLMLWDSGFSAQTRRSFLFGTLPNVDALQDADHWIMDGTFKSAPKYFTQMFTLHGLFPDGWHMPLTYGLLPGKTTTLYKNLFEEIDSYGPFQPQSIQCDFELAVHNAVAEVWPSSTRRGCNFHHKKALLKHLRQCDLMEEYLVTDSVVREHFKMMGAIAFVPVYDVPRVWRYVKPLLPADMATFSAYYESTWIGTSSTNPNFSHDMWNFHDSSVMLLPRSINIAEGFHNGFRSMLSCSNPTIWKFLDCVKDEQDLTDVKLTKKLHKESPEPRADKWIKYDQKLQRIIDAYDDYAILDFLKVVGNML